MVKRDPVAAVLHPTVVVRPPIRVIRSSTEKSKDGGTVFATTLRLPPIRKPVRRKRRAVKKRVRTRRPAARRFRKRSYRTPYRSIYKRRLY